MKDCSYQSDEMIRYLFDYRQELFGIPKDEPSYVFFDGFFATMLVEIVETFLDQEKKKAEQAEKEGKEYSPRNVAANNNHAQLEDDVRQGLWAECATLCMMLDTISTSTEDKSPYHKFYNKPSPIINK